MSNPFKAEIEQEIQELREEWQEVNYDLGCHYLLPHAARGMDWKKTHTELAARSNELRTQIRELEAQIALS